MKKLYGLCLLGLFCLLAWGAGALEAPDITASCVFSGSGNSEQVENIRTASLVETWVVDDSIYLPYLQIDTPAESPAYGVYVIWTHIPAKGQVYIRNPEVPDDQAIPNGEEGWAEGPAPWAPIQAYGERGFKHEYIPLEGLTSFRLSPSRVADPPFAISQVIVLGQGELPGHIQVWEPPLAQADLLVLSTHPDDELIFMGGTLPTYAGERGVSTQVVYMTYSRDERHSELLNGLWLCGVRNYPVLGDFIDTLAYDRERVEAYWGRDDALAFITEQLRRFRPTVVVSHDLDGEYGHGAHKVTADCVLESVRDLVWDDACFPESAQAYGVHDVLKLYLHLYPEGNIWMDWRVPLSAFGGKTGLEVAANAFSEHLSQLGGLFRVTDTSDTSCASFGLAFTLVGPDEQGDDFFENIP